MKFREPRRHDPAFLAFLRLRSCVACGRPGPSDPAHIRIGLFAMGMKPHDEHATPLCMACHERQHKNETRFWRELGKDPFEIAMALYAEYGGSGGKPRAPRKVRPRKPEYLRQKIPSRPFRRKS